MESYPECHDHAGIENLECITIQRGILFLARPKLNTPLLVLGLSHLDELSQNRSNARAAPTTTAYVSFYGLRDYTLQCSRESTQAFLAAPKFFPIIGSPLRVHYLMLRMYGLCIYLALFLSLAPLSHPDTVSSRYGVWQPWRSS